jgi:RimJ/RimL family protein N-acetyltransferase
MAREAGVARVVARTAVDDRASIAVLSRHGFAPTGVGSGGEHVFERLLAVP